MQKLYVVPGTSVHLTALVYQTVLCERDPQVMALIQFKVMKVLWNRMKTYKTITSYNILQVGTMASKNMAAPPYQQQTFFGFFDLI